MISLTLDEAFDKVQALASDFEANKNHYLSPEYQEAEVRKDFIDKFFIALGWDVNHETQKNPYEQEVKVERTDGSSKRRADYAFRVAPNYRDVQFYVEAKSPLGTSPLLITIFKRSGMAGTARRQWWFSPTSRNCIGLSRSGPRV